MMPTAQSPTRVRSVRLLDWRSKTGASYTGDIFTPTAGTINVESNITSDTTWSSSNTYVLTDIIYVTGDATLTIEAGTTIKGEPKSAGAFDPGTLVITQGSKIEAVGTAEAPIIFTSTEDDGSLTEADSGLWGGVILLGKATINRPAGTEYIEGLPHRTSGSTVAPTMPITQAHSSTSPSVMVVQQSPLTTRSTV